MWNGISIIKNDKNHNEIKFEIWKKIVLQKFQCMLQLNYSFYGGLYLSIIFNKIFIKVYYNMNNEKIENFNVWYDFIFEVHL
jgi:hypothetical protein